MNNSHDLQDKAKITFTYDDNQRADEIIALKTLLFGIIRSLPHEIAINSIQAIEDNHNDPVLNNLCKEIADAMIATTTIPTEH